MAVDEARDAARSRARLLDGTTDSTWEKPRTREQHASRKRKCPPTETSEDDQKSVEDDQKSVDIAASSVSGDIKEPASQPISTESSKPTGEEELMHFDKEADVNGDADDDFNEVFSRVSVSVHNVDRDIAKSVFNAMKALMVPATPSDCSGMVSRSENQDILQLKEALRQAEERLMLVLSDEDSAHKLEELDRRARELTAKEEDLERRSKLMEEHHRYFLCVFFSFFLETRTKMRYYFFHRKELDLKDEELRQLRSELAEATKQHRPAEKELKHVMINSSFSSETKGWVESKFVGMEARCGPPISANIDCQSMFAAIGDPHLASILTNLDSTQPFVSEENEELIIKYRSIELPQESQAEDTTYKKKVLSKMLDGAPLLEEDIIRCLGENWVNDQVS